MDNENAVAVTSDEDRSKFEFGDDPVQFEVEIRGKKAVYLLKDVPAGEADKLFQPLITGNDVEKKKAQQRFRNKVIALVVARADGTDITEDEASKFRTQLAVKLAAEAMKFLQVEEGEAKNESAET